MMRTTRRAAAIFLPRVTAVSSSTASAFAFLRPKLWRPRHHVYPDPMAGSAGQNALDHDRLDALMGELNVPAQVRGNLRVRIEPVKRLQSEHVVEPTFGVFMMWKPKSVLNGEADVTHLIDLPTCLAVRRACRDRGIYVVDNTGLPAVTTPSARLKLRAALRKL